MSKNKIRKLLKNYSANMSVSLMCDISNMKIFLFLIQKNLDHPNMFPILFWNFANMSMQTAN